MGENISSLVGGTLGISLGSAISTFLPKFLTRLGLGGNVRNVVPISLLIGALFLSIIIGVIAEAIPAYRASKLKPVDVLRYE